MDLSHTVLCGCPNSLQYKSCRSVCLSVYLSVTYAICEEIKRIKTKISVVVTLGRYQYASF